MKAKNYSFEMKDVQYGRDNEKNICDLMDILGDQFAGVPF